MPSSQRAATFSATSPASPPRPRAGYTKFSPTPGYVAVEAAFLWYVSKSMEEKVPSAGQGATDAAAPVAREPEAPRVTGMTTPTKNQGPPAILAVDGPSLFHRAYHAYERTGLTSQAGKPRFAVYGFFALLAGVVDKTRPGGLVVGFDDESGGARAQLYPAYKGQRSEKPASLKAQLSDVKRLLTELQIVTITPTGLEADDVVASVSKQVEKRGGRCIVATSDRDSFALVSPTTHVLRLVSGLENAVRVDPAKVQELYGVTPEQYPDFAALRGDTSDNLPGVQGFGEKTAAKLLAALGSVDAALLDPAATEEAIGKSAAKKLVAGISNYHTNKQVMRLVGDIPVDLDAAIRAPRREDVVATMTRWELPNLVERVANAFCGPPKKETARQTTSAAPQQGELLGANPEAAPGRVRNVFTLPDSIPGTTMKWPTTL